MAFDNLKALLSSSPIPVDASDFGVGAVLLQDDSVGIEHHVCFLGFFSNEI